MIVRKRIYILFRYYYQFLKLDKLCLSNFAMSSIKIKIYKLVLFNNNITNNKTFTGSLL